MIILVMLGAIIEQLSKIYPCYRLENFDVKDTLSQTFYFVVEMGEPVRISRFGHTPLFVYIYAPRQSHYILKEIKKEICKILHKKKFAKKDEEGNFWIEYINEVFSRIDSSVDKRCVCLEFRVPSV